METTDEFWEGSHTAWTQTASHISLSAGDVLRLVRTLSLFISTLSLNIVLDRWEHRSLYKIPLATDYLGTFMIPIAPRLYSKERYRILWNFPISSRSLSRHAFSRCIYNRTMDWVKYSDGGTSERGKDGKENGDWERGGRPFFLSKIGSTSQCVCLCAVRG